MFACICFAYLDILDHTGHVQVLYRVFFYTHVYIYHVSAVAVKLFIHEFIATTAYTDSCFVFRLKYPISNKSWWIFNKKH